MNVLHKNVDSGLVRRIGLSWVMVTLDLLTTRYVLQFPNVYEANKFGNIPIIEYSICILFTYLLYRYEKHFNMEHNISLLYAFLPIVAVLNNLFFIFTYF